VSRASYLHINSVSSEQPSQRFLGWVVQMLSFNACSFPGIFSSGPASKSQG
jgi:hypothetical protein